MQIPKLPRARPEASRSRHRSAQCAPSWGQNRQHHPHIHCIVPAGGLTKDRFGWIHASPRFFLPVRVLSRVFRGKFAAGLKQLFDQDKLQFHGSLIDLAQPDCFRRFFYQLFRQNWVVYAKPPFGGAEQVLHSLARYTHSVAISNHRLVAFHDDRVSFCWKDYAHGGKQKLMTLSADEFLRRFLLHVLPRGLVRIRHFGLFANRRRAAMLALCRSPLGPPLALASQGSTQLCCHPFLRRTVPTKAATTSTHPHRNPIDTTASTAPAAHFKRLYRNCPTTGTPHRHLVWGQSR